MTNVIPLIPRRDEDIKLATGNAQAFLALACVSAERSHEPIPTLVAAISAFLRALDKDHHPGVKLGVLAAIAQDFTEEQIATAVRTFREGGKPRLDA